MLVKITNGVVDKFPYTVGQLRRDNPNTSFPKNISNLDDYGIFNVRVFDAPEYDARTQTIEKSKEPELVNDEWCITWTIVDKSEDEIQQYDDSIAQSVRSTRDGLLSSSDWTQVNDAPVDAQAWATYRQALRDITDHENFPYLQNEDWPVKP